jgi:hypothetical protein
MLKLRLFVIPLFLLAASAVAQEFDIFDPNDFLDPRVRGASFNTTGLGLSKEGDTFSSIRAYSGRVTDYQWRNQPTDIDLTFLHLAGSIYRGDKQFSLKFTGFDPDQGAEQLPRYRTTAQFGYYFATQSTVPGREDSQRVSGRLLFNYTFEDAATTSSGVRQHAHEYGVEADAYVRLGPVPVMGSLVWTRRAAGESDTSDRVSYLYRPPNLRFHHLNLKAVLGVGAEHSQSWHMGALRGVFTAGYELPWDFTFNASYAPAYLPGLPNRRTYHELAIYVDRTILARFTGAVTR